MMIRSPTSTLQFQVNITGWIYDALAGDFDGDSKLDLFVLYKTEQKQKSFHGGVLWGDRVRLSDLQPHWLSIRIFRH